MPHYGIVCGRGVAGAFPPHSFTRPHPALCVFLRGLGGGIDAPLSMTLSQAAGSRATLSLSGEIDLSNAGALAARLQALAATGRWRVVVDMRRVGFCDCAVSRHRRRPPSRHGLPRGSRHRTRPTIRSGQHQRRPTQHLKPETAIEARAAGAGQGGPCRLVERMVWDVSDSSPSIRSISMTRSPSAYQLSRGVCSCSATAWRSRRSSSRV